jgi:hypothetical protein
VRYTIAPIDAVIVTVPIAPLAETPVRTTLTGKLTETVPRVPAALTPVRVTFALAVGVAAKGVSAKGEKPNIYPLLSFQC